MANGLIGFMLFLCYESQLITGDASRLIISYCPDIYCMIFPIGGVYVTIRGANVSENGYIDFDLIGSTYEDAVLCHTNDPTCCAKGQVNPGHWYFPDNTIVESYTNNVEPDGSVRYFFARNRGRNPPVVRLYHIHHASNMVAQERGRFRCEIRDAAGNLQQLHVNICKLH